MRGWPGLAGGVRALDSPQARAVAVLRPALSVRYLEGTSTRLHWERRARSAEYPDGAKQAKPVTFLFSRKGCASAPRTRRRGRYIFDGPLKVARMPAVV